MMYNNRFLLCMWSPLGWYSVWWGPTKATGGHHVLLWGDRLWRQWINVTVQEKTLSTQEPPQLLNSMLCNAERILSKFRIGQSDQCPWQTGSMKTEHLLRACPLHDRLRRNIFAEQTTMPRKQFGTNNAKEAVWDQQCQWSSLGDVQHMITFKQSRFFHLNDQQEQLEVITILCDVEIIVFDIYAYYVRS